MASLLQKTPLFDYHCEVSAKMVPTGSWTMPFQFGDGCKAEYLHAFEGTCITDFCCAGIYRMTGVNADEIRNISKIQKVGECCIYEWKKDNHLIDTPFAVCMAENDFLTAFAPSAGKICTESFDTTEMQDLSEVFGCIAVWGSECFETLSKLGIAAGDWQSSSSCRVEIDSVRCIANYITLDNELPCVILFFDREKTDDVWIALFNTPGVWVAGTGAWDMMRIQQILPPWNTVNCPLPLLLCEWRGNKIPLKHTTVEWQAKNAVRQAQIIYTVRVPDTDTAFLLFSGEFEANSCVKTPENTEESGILVNQRC